MAYAKGKLVVEGNSTTRTVAFTTRVVGPVGGEIVTEVSDPLALAAIAREILSALPKPEPVPVVAIAAQSTQPVPSADAKVEVK